MKEPESENLLGGYRDEEKQASGKKAVKMISEVQSDDSGPENLQHVGEEQKEQPKTYEELSEELQELCLNTAAVATEAQLE